MGPRCRGRSGRAPAGRGSTGAPGRGGLLTVAPPACKGLVPLREPLGPSGAPEPWLPEALDALADAVRRGRIGRLGVERFDGQPVVGSPVEALLVDAGFRQGPRKLTLSA